MLTPESPETYPRRILLAVTGLSPQIVTETVYALAIAARQPWIPTEVHLVTTREGAQGARLLLLSEEPGWFARLLADWKLPPIAFPSENIYVITGPDGAPLDDIRSAADNDAAADFICDTVRRLTEDDRAALHVSLAGGRKTMGFYLGYALSLYARPQDRLSHVLVSSPYESNSQFFYPAPETRVLACNHGQAVDAKDATVTLARIPFVRLREGLPKELLEGKARFSEVVAEAQKALPPVSLTLDPARRMVIAGGESFMLKPAEFAFYLMLAERRRKGISGAHWSDKVLDQEIKDCYARVIKPHSGDFVRFEERGMSKDNFNARKAHINKALKNALGERRAAPYLISVLDPLDLPGAKRCRPYGLSVPAEAININDLASLRGRRQHERAG